MEWSLKLRDQTFFKAKNSFNNGSKACQKFVSTSVWIQATPTERKRFSSPGGIWRKLQNEELIYESVKKGSHLCHFSKPNWTWQLFRSVAISMISYKFWKLFSESFIGSIFKKVPFLNFWKLHFNIDFTQVIKTLTIQISSCFDLYAAVW